MTALPADLAEIVLQKTREGKLKWSELSSDSYFAEIGYDGVIVEAGPLGAGSVLRFVNKDRAEVGSISGIERSAFGWLAAQTPNPSVDEIYQLPRRQVLRVDDALAEIKHTFENL